MSIETLGLQDRAGLDPGGLTSRIYVGDQYTLLHTKYITCEPQGFTDNFLSFSHCKTMDTLDLHVRANLDPRGLIGRIYVGDHLALHTTH